MDNTVQFECEEVEDVVYSCVKPEPDVVEYEPAVNPTGSCSDITPTSTNTMVNSYELQTNTVDSGLDEQNQVVCAWDSADDVEMESSHLWALSMCSSQAASNDDGVVAVQPEQLRDSSHKPQKTMRLWPISKHNKWQRRYSQRAVRQHKCTECAETFLHKRSLHRHVTIVHGPKVYFWCKRCCHFYNRRDNLRTHYRSHHPMYINDVKHIQGVRRETLLSERLPLFNNPLASSSSINPGSSSSGGKFGAQSRKHQATQLTEREQGGVNARQENSRMRTVFVHREKDKTDGKSISQTTAPGRQSGVRPTPEKPTSSLSVPPLNNSQQQARRPSAKAPSSSSTVAASRGNPITVSDVLTYQLQREATQAEAEILVISEDSSSDGEPELPPVGSRDKDTVRLERGAPFKDLHVETVMQGQVSRVSEEHQTFIYSGGEKIRTDTRKRIYNVLHLDGVGEGMQHTAQAATATSSNSMSDDQLSKNIQGRVTKVTEISSKYTYSAGKKVTKEKTSRIYDVMLLGGLTNI